MKKRILAAFLALVLVVTGLYIAKPEAKEVKAADAQSVSTKVPTEMLGIKMQPKIHDNDTEDTSDDTMDLRIVSSVDSLNYKEVGFYVWYGEDAKNPTDTNRTAHFRTWSVLERIQATSKVAYNFSPKVIDTCSEYFVTGTIMGIAYKNWETDFYIEAYCITKDGETETGVGRYFNVKDATAAKTINIPVAMDAVNVGATLNNVSVAGKTTSATVEAYLDGYAHLNVAVPSDYAHKTDLPSASVVAVGDDSAVYRNLESAYAGKGTEDTSWYTAYEGTGETEFIIATDADLYGFSKLGESNTFSGDTIYVVADIDANDGKVTTTGFDPSEGATVYDWTPIGGKFVDNTNLFAGTFDGGKHTISGIVISNNNVIGGSWGLFGYTENCTIQNFTLKNSYFYLQTGKNQAQLGAVAGQSKGTIDTVKIDSDVRLEHVSTNGAEATGGIVGAMSSYGTSKITNCWFDGTITAGARMGGILGVANDRTTQDTSDTVYKQILIENCLNSGTLNLNVAATCIGGICGDIYRSQVLFENCLNTSTYNKNGFADSNTSGSLAGWIRNSASTVTVPYTAEINDCYVLKGSNWARLATKSGSAVMRVNGTTVSSSTTGFLEEAKLVGEQSYLNMNLDFSIKDAYKGVWTVTTTTPVLSSFLSNEEIFDLDEVTTARTFWYDNADANATTYTLYTTADMLGFASLVNGGTDFSSKTVRLGADITMNKGNASTNGFALEVEGDELFEWTPMSIVGTFDGDGHTIRGIYVDAVNGDGSVGLFSTVSGTVKNLFIRNSYFNHADATTANSYASAKFTAPIGSVAGILSGTLDTVYSDAFVQHAGAHAGGLVGIIQTDGATIENCCYAGSITAVGSVGGILGLLVDANATIKHCMNAGSIGGGYATGGICGQVWHRTRTTELLVQDNLNVGRHIKTSASQPWRGGVVGYLASYASVNTENTYMIGDYADGTNTWDKSAFLGSNNSTVIDGENVYSRSNNPTSPKNTSWVVKGFYGEADIIAKTYINLSYYPVGQDSSNDGGAKTYYWVAREGKIPMLESFEDLLTNITY